MNKKARLMMLILVAIVVGLVVFLIVFPGTARLLLSKIGLLPKPPTPPPGTSGSEVLRYSLIDNTVEYWDGVGSFVSFQGQTVKLNDKEINWNDARYYFADNYYYKAGKRETLNKPIQSNEMQTLLSMNKNFCIFANRIQAVDNDVGGKGDIPLIILEQTNEECDFTKKQGNLYFRTSNRLDFLPKDQTSDELEDITERYPELYQEVSEKATTWADSILSEKMEFKYNDNSVCILVPVEKIDNIYLLTNLAEGEPC